MGAKRPLQEENFPGLSFKQPKQLDYLNQITLPAVDFPTFIPILAADSPVEGKSNFNKFQYDERLHSSDTYDAFVAEKEVEASAPLSLGTSSSSEEDTGYGDSNFLSCFPRFLDLSIPRQQRVVEQVEDPYISLLNNSPRKEVPIGPDHQAEIPEWNGKDFYDSNSEVEQNMMGTSVIPMPDLNDSIINEAKSGRGRTDCSCMDAGSMRCVQQHVKEVRENLRDTIGEDKFADLGFYNMGEEVACKWTPYEEKVFHEVVFSNPARHGGNFWMQLSAVFPTRTNMEIMSYYFNVFMLRRRAVQNRSYMLEIDSDDDEEHRGGVGPHGNFNKNESFLLDGDANDVEYDDYHRQGGSSSYLVNNNNEDDDDSTVESFADQDLDTSWVDDDCWSRPENVHKQDVDVIDHVRDETSGDGTHE